MSGSNKLKLSSIFFLELNNTRVKSGCWLQAELHFLFWFWPKFLSVIRKSSELIDTELPEQLRRFLKLLRIIIKNSQQLINQLATELRLSVLTEVMMCRYHQIVLNISKKYPPLGM